MFMSLNLKKNLFANKKNSLLPTDWKFGKIYLAEQFLNNASTYLVHEHADRLIDIVLGDPQSAFDLVEVGEPHGEDHANILVLIHPYIL